MYWVGFHVLSKELNDTVGPGETKSYYLPEYKGRWNIFKGIFLKFTSDTRNFVRNDPGG